MEFCKVCGHSYIITNKISTIKKDSSTSQTGGSKDDIIDILLNNGELPKKHNFTIDKIKNMDNFKKLDEDKQVLVLNTFENKSGSTRKKISKSVENAKKEKINENIYYLCELCGYHEKLKPETLIYKKLYTFDDVDYTERVEDFSYMLDNDTLPRTIEYVCPNQNCDKNKKNAIGEAIFFMNKKLKKKVYVCNLCKISWYI